MTTMRSLIGQLPSQLRWAADLEEPTLGPADQIVVTAMGGSAIAGDYVAPETAGQVSTHRTYGLPGWAQTRRPLVLAISYSGDTEETLDAVKTAHRSSLPVAVVTSGGVLAGLAAEHGWESVIVPTGLPPRAAIGYLAGATLRLVGATGQADQAQASLSEAASVTEAVLHRGGAAEGLALDLAEAIADRIPVFCGAGITAAVARRFKTQVNENAKRVASWSVMPEANHNEISGWDDPRVAGRACVLFLRDRQESLEIARQFDLTGRRLTGLVAGEVHTTGKSALARMFSATAVGDLLSVCLAEAAQVDPFAIEAIEAIKSGLKE